MGDYGPYYLKQFMHMRLAGKHSDTTLQFWRHTFGEGKDLPDKGNKKDQLLLFLSGLDQVDFDSFSKDVVTCLEGVYGGTAQILDGEENMDRSRCAAEDKDLG